MVQVLVLPKMRIQVYTLRSSNLAILLPLNAKLQPKVKMSALWRRSISYKKISLQITQKLMVLILRSLKGTMATKINSILKWMISLGLLSKSADLSLRISCLKL